MSWKRIQKENFTDIEELAAFLELPYAFPLLKKSKFPLNLPRRIALKISKNNLEDPILRQFLPIEDENRHSGYTDPVQDASFQKTSHLLHKYAGRMLIVTTGACAMNCRFCFRQNYEYSSGGDFSKELEILSQDETIEEVLLSGGDPLSLSNRRLRILLENLAKIPHVKRIRFHTRFPVGIPERIDGELLTILEKCPQQIIFILHINLAEELDPDITSALKKIARLGIPILTQTVLLRGVNDSLEVLKKLFLTLVNNGLIPYYLHQLDPVQGAMHFEVLLHKELLEALHAELPGYALPRFVKEEPFAKGKTLL
ncbi:MAG: KamA family radical SAM protein [Chlamydiae bacterium]|nr:KamA family radical SAM protein [Chlamydiota bacterium]